MEGWIKLHRCLLGKAIWKCSTPEQCKLLITLLLLANHEPNQWIWKGEKYECQAGQFITSLKSLSNTTGLSMHQVRTALEKFEKLDFLTSEVSNKNRLITIVNWGFYQDSHTQSGKQMTNEWQASGKQVATNKNDKNDNNEKNDKNTHRFVKPTVDELKDYIWEKGYHIDAEAFFAYYESNGWKVGRNPMKSWQSALVTWERKAKKGGNNQSSGIDWSKV